MTKIFPQMILEDITTMLSKSVHDINNPLSVVMGQASILEILIDKENVSKEKLHSTISKILAGANKMKDRIDHLRDYYKIFSNDPSFQSWPAIEKAVIFLFSSYENKKITLNYEKMESFPNDTAKAFAMIYSLCKLEQDTIDIHIEPTGNDSIKFTVAFSNGTEKPKFLKDFIASENLEEKTDAERIHLIWV